MAYRFDESLERGEAHERDLDAHYRRWFDIEHVTRDGQRQGIDRMFTCRRDGKVYAVEYKSDETASRTGNAFVETVSVDTADKPGWACTSRADLLLYYLPHDLLCYVVRFTALRKRLPVWEATCRVRRIPNAGGGNPYHTHGLLVPLCEFERIAWEVHNIAADGSAP